MSLLNKASLIQIPSGYKDGTLYSAKPTNGDGDFTFSRGSNLAATRVNSEGLIEKGRENLFLHSNDFSQGAWSQNTQGVTRTSSSVTDPDGGTDAWEITTTATTDTHRMGHNINSGLIKTISFYAKANGYDYVRVWSWSGGNTNSNYFYLSGDGSVGGNGYGGIRKIESLGDGWYRCQCLIDGANGDTIVISPSPDENIANSTNSYLGDGTSGIYLFQAQLEAGLVATDYIETGASTAQAGILEDMPRLDYSGGASCPSLLLEPQRTNLVTNSEYVSSSDYVTGNWTGTITTNTSETLSPEGLYNATKFVKSGSTDRVYFQTSVSDGTYTGSMYFKAVSGQEGNTVEISVRRFGGGSGATTKLITLTSEWQRVDVSATLSGGTNTAIYIADFSSSGNANSFYFYGLQLEAGSYVSSYIPTYGSSSTRSKDSCSKTGISSLIGQTEGTLFCEMGEDVNFGTVTTSIFCLDDNTANNRIELSITPTGNGRISFYISNGGTEQVNILSASTLSANDKIAVTYKANDFVVYLNGTAIDTDTSGSVPTTNIARIAQRYDGGRTEKNSFKQAILFPTALTDAECIELTTL